MRRGLLCVLVSVMVSGCFPTAPSGKSTPAPTTRTAPTDPAELAVAEWFKKKNPKGLQHLKWLEWGPSDLRGDLARRALVLKNASLTGEIPSYALAAMLLGQGTKVVRFRCEYVEQSSEKLVVHDQVVFVAADGKIHETVSREDGIQIILCMPVRNEKYAPRYWLEDVEQHLQQAEAKLKTSASSP